MAPVQTIEESLPAVPRTRPAQSEKTDHTAGPFAQILQQHHASESRQDTAQKTQGDDQLAKNTSKANMHESSKKGPKNEANVKGNGLFSNEPAPTKRGAGTARTPLLRTDPRVQKNAAASKQAETPLLRSKANVKQANASQAKPLLGKPDVTPMMGSQIAKASGEELQLFLSLKERVKSILKAPTSRQANQTTTTEFRQDPKTGTKKGRKLHVDKVKPIRISTQPAEINAERVGRKTTIEHLATRKQAEANTKNQPADIQQRLSQSPLAASTRNANSTASNHIVPANNRHEKGGKNGAKKASQTPFQPNVGTDSNSRSSKSKMRRSRSKLLNKIYGGEKGQGAQDQSAIQERQFAAQEPKVQQTLSAKPQTVEGDMPVKDAKAQNVLGKGSSNTLQAASQKAQKSAKVRGHRTAAWMEALANRTSFLDRNHPHWKVMEMKLDSGDGAMTIKVMRESDQVSVAVAFSDASLQAQAEAQSNQIIEALKAQYNQDINLSFSRREGSAFYTETSDSQRRPKVAPKTQNSGASEQEILSHSPLSARDRNVWIG